TLACPARRMLSIQSPMKSTTFGTCCNAAKSRTQRRQRHGLGTLRKKISLLVGHGTPETDHSLVRWAQQTGVSFMKSSKRVGQDESGYVVVVETQELSQAAEAFAQWLIDYGLTREDIEPEAIIIDVYRAAGSEPLVRYRIRRDILDR